MRDFDSMVVPLRPRIFLTRATVKDIPRAYDIMRLITTDIAPENVVADVITHNSDSIQLFIRKDYCTIAGLFAVLMLNEKGVMSLLQGNLNLLNPPLDAIVRTGEKPAALYIWLIIAPGRASEGIMHLAEFLRSPLYRNVDCFGRPIGNVDFWLSMGFEPYLCGVPGLLRYRRRVNR